MNTLHKRSLHLSLFCTLVLLVVTIDEAYAQAANEEGQRGIRLRNLVKPHFDEPRFQDDTGQLLDDVQVLPAPDMAGGDSVATATDLNVTRIVLHNSTVFSDEEVSTWTAPYEGRLVGIDELQSLRQLLSIKYLERGYVNSGVVIPEQTVNDGVVVFHAIEGGLDELTISGNDELNESYLAYRINKGISSPLNVNDLQDALRALQQDRLVRKLDAQLKPLSGLGEAELEVHITEAAEREIAVEITNHRSPSVGSGELALRYTDHNLTGAGDRLNVMVAATEGLDEAALAYTLPVPQTELLLSLYASASESEVVEKPFDQLDIESESISYGVSVAGKSPLFSELPISFYAALNHRESDAFLLGEPFSFAAGAVAGESSSTHLELGLDYSLRSPDQVLAFSVSVRQGLHALDATVAEDGEVPDGEFTALYGQLQFARRLDFIPGSQLLVRSAFQNSLDALLPLEKLAVGGHSTVRGYRENQLVRDNGVIVTAELRVPIMAGSDGGRLEGVVFADWGEAWDEDVPSQDDEKIAIGSVGLGLLWSPLKNLDVELFWGEALDEDVIENQDGKLQDDGIHVSISYGVQF